MREWMKIHIRRFGGGITADAVTKKRPSPTALIEGDCLFIFLLFYILYFIFF